MQSPVFTPEIEERITARFVTRTQHSSHENDMITSIKQRVAFTFETGQRSQ